MAKNAPVWVILVSFNKVKHYHTSKSAASPKYKQVNIKLLFRHSLVNIIDFLYFGIDKQSHSNIQWCFIPSWMLCFWMKRLREWFSDPFNRNVHFCYCCPIYQSIANYKYIHLYYISKWYICSATGSPVPFFSFCSSMIRSKTGLRVRSRL